MFGSRARRNLRAQQQRQRQLDHNFNITDPYMGPTFRPYFLQEGPPPGTLQEVFRTFRVVYYRVMNNGGRDFIDRVNEQVADYIHSPFNHPEVPFLVSVILAASLSVILYCISFHSKYWMNVFKDDLTSTSFGPEIMHMPISLIAGFGYCFWLYLERVGIFDQYQINRVQFLNKIVIGIITLSVIRTIFYCILSLIARHAFEDNDASLANLGLHLAVKSLSLPFAILCLIQCIAGINDVVQPILDRIFAVPLDPEIEEEHTFDPDYTVQLYQQAYIPIAHARRNHATLNTIPVVNAASERAEVSNNLNGEMVKAGIPLSIQSYRHI